MDLIFSLEDKIRCIPPAQLNSLPSIYPLESTIHLLNDLTLFKKANLFLKSLLTSLFTFFLMSIRLNSKKPVADPGEGPGGPAPPYFSTKMRPEGPNKIFWGTGPPPLSEGLDDRPPHPPSYLKIWIRHWKSWPKIKFKR